MVYFLRSWLECWDGRRRLGGASFYNDMLIVVEYEPQKILEYNSKGSTERTSSKLRLRLNKNVQVKLQYLDRLQAYATVMLFTRMRLLVRFSLSRFVLSNQRFYSPIAKGLPRGFVL